MQLEINKINYLRDLVQLEPHVSSEKRLHENRRFIQLSWQTQSISLVFPKQPDFQMYLTCSPVSAPRRLAVGSSFFSSLLLICWSFIHSMRCNCCSLVALAFSCSLLCSFGRRESEAKAEAPALSGKQKKQKKKHPGQMWDGLPHWPVPEVWCGFWITGITHGFVSAVLDWKYEWPYLGGEESRGEAKTKGALWKICRQSWGEKRTRCQNFCLWVMEPWAGRTLTDSAEIYVTY